jgi:hypothetical protein
VDDAKEILSLAIISVPCALSDRSAVNGAELPRWRVLFL